MPILLSSPNPKIILKTSQKLSRIVPLFISSSCKFRISMDQGTIKIKLPEKTRKKMKKNSETDTEKIIGEEKGKRDFVKPRMVFPVKKMTSVISGVFISKKTFVGENRGQKDDSIEITKTVGKVQAKQNPIQKESLWQNARIQLKIIALGHRLKTRRRSLSEDIGAEELCKKRILMGERCKPINKSGVLHYDTDGILLPEP